MINRADKAALLPVQKNHSLAGIYTGVSILRSLLGIYSQQRNPIFKT